LFFGESNIYLNMWDFTRMWGFYLETICLCEELVGVTWRLSDCEELVGVNQDVVWLNLR